MHKKVATDKGAMWDTITDIPRCHVGDACTRATLGVRARLRPPWHTRRVGTSSPGSASRRPEAGISKGLGGDSGPFWGQRDQWHVMRPPLKRRRARAHILMGHYKADSAATAVRYPPSTSTLRLSIRAVTGSIKKN